MKDIIDYIITWLCYGDTNAAKRIAYTADEKALKDHDLIIIPNGHLGQDLLLPELKRPIVEQPKKGKSIIRTDIVYTTFFFISRAEELIRFQRDEHDRFAAKYSILGFKSRTQIPRLDEYARLVLKQLNLPLPEPGFAHIYLTHDIDSIDQYRHLRGLAGGIKRGEVKQALSSIRNINKDPQYTFPWLIEQDAKVPNAETIYFVKHTKGRGFDYPQYCLCGHDYKRVKKLLLESGAKLGIHSSYYGDLPPYTLHNTQSTLHRSHYLRCSIDQMQRLADAGYTDDFTMGFADQAGFRLQTTRAVRWINPKTMQLTNLTLHPLTVMDCTLSNDNYMNLTEDEAYFLCERLIEKVKLHHGDLCLLWHNGNLTPDKYHRSLYQQLINYIADQK